MEEASTSPQVEFQNSDTYVAHEITGAYRDSLSEAFPKFRYLFKKWAIFLATTSVLVYIVVTASLEITRKDVSSLSSSPSCVFGVVTIFLSGFAFALLTYGVLKCKQYDLYGCLIVLLAIEVYTGVDYSSDKERQHYLKTIQLVWVAVTCVAMVVLCQITVADLNWKEFQIAGVSAWLLDMYRKRCYFTALLRIDFCFTITFGLFALYSYSPVVSLWTITVAVSAYAILIWMLGTYSVLREKKILLFAFTCLGMVLFLWIPSQIYAWRLSTSREHSLKSQPFILYGAIGTGIFVAFVRMYVYVQVIKIYKNFGYGLGDRGFQLLLSPESTSLLSPP